MDASIEGNRSVAAAIRAGNRRDAGAATRRMIRNAWAIIGRVVTDGDTEQPPP